MKLSKILLDNIKRLANVKPTIHIYAMSSSIIAINDNKSLSCKVDVPDRINRDVIIHDLHQFARAYNSMDAETVDIQFEETHIHIRDKNNQFNLEYGVKSSLYILKDGFTFPTTSIGSFIITKDLLSRVRTASSIVESQDLYFTAHAETGELTIEIKHSNNSSGNNFKHTTKINGCTNDFKLSIDLALMRDINSDFKCVCASERVIMLKTNNVEYLMATKIEAN